MSHFFQPYTILLFSAVAISAALAIAVLRYRPNLGTHSFAVLMGAVSMWSFMTIFEVVPQDLPTKLFSGNFKYLFIVTVPVAWFSFGLYYSNRLRRLRPAHLALLAAVPALTLLLLATNEFHHLMFRSLHWHRATDSILLPLREFGVWFWVHTAYSYTLVFLGFLFLARSIIDSQRIYRSQVISLLVAALAPWLCNVFFLTGAQPLPHLDLTPFAFTISGLAVMWGIVRYRLLDIVPIAHDIVIQNMSEGVIVMDNRHRILNLNSAAADLAGMQQQDLIGRSAEQVISWWPRVSKALNLPALIEIDHAGRTRQLQMTASVLHNREKPLGHLVVLRDITEAKTAQEALRRSEERFRALSENAPVIILSLDESGMITYVNPAWKTILGHDREEVLGRPFAHFVIQEQLQICTDSFNRLISGHQRVAEGNVNFRHKNDRTRIFGLTAAVNSDGEGRITGIICLAKDITEEKLLQDQLFQAQKMEAIGTLAGGIAHDFNNLLMGMQANVSLMRLESEAIDTFQDKLKRIEDQIQCGASLTRQLLGYARKGKYVVAPIDVHRLIEETLQVVQRTHKNIEIDCMLDAQPAYLEADQGQIESVLLNLYVNAADAMPTGGRLTVSTRLAQHRELSGDWPELEPGRFFEIKIADTGVGMDQSTMDRIFEPFFTTKEIGRGTGLGLASVYGVVKNHHGQIRVESTIGKGTTFVLLFPAAAVSAEQVRTPRTAALASLREGNVLLVDDEPPILQYIGEMIQSLGFQVLSACNGKDALDIFKESHKTIDLVILDMFLPGMDGSEVFRHLRAIDPLVKVIIASGYGMTRQTESVLELGGYLLAKPFTREELAQAISDISGCSNSLLEPTKSALRMPKFETN